MNTIIYVNLMVKVQVNCVDQYIGRQKVVLVLNKNDDGHDAPNYTLYRRSQLHVLRPQCLL